MAADTGQIRREVEEARERLGQTVEAIAYRVNAPRRMKDRAARRMRAMTGRHSNHARS